MNLGKKEIDIAQVSDFLASPQALYLGFVLDPENTQGKNVQKNSDPKSRFAEM